MQHNHEPTPEELFAQYTAATDPQAKEALRERFFEQTYEYIDQFIRSFKRSNIPRHELISIAQMGLLDAFNTFQPERNSKFVSYASVVVKCDLTNYYRRRHLRYRELLSLDAEIKSASEDGDNTLYAILHTGEQIDVPALQSAVMQLVYEAAQTVLDERERMFFYNQPALTEISQQQLADRLKVSQMTVSRIVRQANQKVRRYLEKHGCTKELLLH